jgi:hypothetical protein
MQSRSCGLRTAGGAAAALLALAALAVPLRAEELPAPRQRYAIEVSFDPERHVVEGRERIHLYNHSDRLLTSLVFHLYLNAFRDARSVFMREGGAELRGVSPATVGDELSRPGRCEVTSLRTAAGQDLLDGAERELVPGDFSQLRLQLPAALPPGAALDLELTFRSELPELLARSGYAREFHLVGQWFPKLARLNPDGSWAGFPYHGTGEFFADFADYTFEVRAPKRFRVAASGERVESRELGAQRSDRFVARSVHDVVWAADPYLERRAEQIGAVRVQIYAPRGYGAAQRRQLSVLRAALPYFEQRYGRYPYPGLTVLIPPAHGAGASGMEYPTFFASGGPWWALPAWAPDLAHDIVVAHEFAHQWFSGMIASDEVSHPMLDEGLAQWSSLDFLRSFYRAPPSALARHRPPFELFDVARALFLTRRAAVPSSLLPAYEYRWRTLGRAVYMRPALVFERIAERFGRERLERAISRYARAQRFEHPTPDDLFAAFDAELGAGFSGRVLRPALEGGDPAELAPNPEPALKALNGYRFLSELWLIAQWLLHGLGA